MLRHKNGELIQGRNNLKVAGRGLCAGRGCERGRLARGPRACCVFTSRGPTTGASPHLGHTCLVYTCIATTATHPGTRTLCAHMGYDVIHNMPTFLFINLEISGNIMIQHLSPRFKLKRKLNLKVTM